MGKRLETFCKPVFKGNKQPLSMIYAKEDSANPKMSMYFTNADRLPDFKLGSDKVGSLFEKFHMKAVKNKYDSKMSIVSSSVEEEKMKKRKK